LDLTIRTDRSLNEGWIFEKLSKKTTATNFLEVSASNVDRSLVAEKRNRKELALEKKNDY